MCIVSNWTSSHPWTTNWSFALANWSDWSMSMMMAGHFASVLIALNKASRLEHVSLSSHANLALPAQLDQPMGLLADQVLKTLLVSCHGQGPNGRMSPAMNRPMSPANARGAPRNGSPTQQYSPASTGSFNQAPRPLSPGPHRPQQKRSMSPGPYGPGAGPRPMTPPNQRRRSNSAGAPLRGQGGRQSPGPSKLGPGNGAAWPPARRPRTRYCHVKRRATNGQACFIDWLLAKDIS